MIVSALDVTSCNPVSAPALTPRGHNLRVFLIPSKIGGRDPSRGPAQIIGQEAILRLQIEPLNVAPCFDLAAKRFVREQNINGIRDGLFHALSIFSLA